MPGINDIAFDAMVASDMDAAAKERANAPKPLKTPEYMLYYMYAAARFPHSKQPGVPNYIEDTAKFIDSKKQVLPVRGDFDMRAWECWKYNCHDLTLWKQTWPWPGHYNKFPMPPTWPKWPLPEWWPPLPNQWPKDR